MKSPQTLSLDDRRRVAAWAADCAQHVLALFEREAPGDTRPADLIARARAFADGTLGAADAIRMRFSGGVRADAAIPDAAAMAARSAGQAAAVCHMGAHGIGAAAYAVRAVELSRADDPGAAESEIVWQVAQMPTEVRTVLNRLPAVGEDTSGPLGPGLLATGAIGSIVVRVQTALRQ
ncbi:MAG: hypothetical protein KDB69_10120 [Acidimicrobiia bacterium]|nr:hypothetical protein [Acidimicrobiia bacterium]